MTTITIEEAIVHRALSALEYHTQQTRPIHNTELVIEELRAALTAPATAPDDRVKELEAELAATETVITEYRQQCLDNAAEIARLRKLIADHVNSSNNDDSAGDTFGALMAEVQPKHKPKPFIGTRSAIYKCTDCGHEQSVQEIHTEYGVYVGSGANWCDKCGDGKPERKQTP